MNNLIETIGLCKRYRGFTLDHIDLTVPEGTIVGLIGENGAGKTTTIKAILNVIHPDAGTVRLMGMDPQRQAARQQVGVVFEDSYFYGGLSGAQIDRIMAGIHPQWDSQKFRRDLRRFDLDPKKPVKDFSRGMRMKISLATALASHPRLLVLDEATSGLDPVVRGEMLDLFLEFIQDESHSILMSSHITSDLEQIADSIAYLHHGQLLFHEDKDALMQEYGLLRCGEADLHRLPEGVAVFTKKGAFGCETLVKGRETVLHLLPGAVCDPAGIDDIMRFYSGRDGQ